MEFTRREFIRGGVSAFTIGFAAPAFLSDLARAQGASRRCLVVLYLSGGNDALSTVVPYTDPFYRSRRPNIQVAPGTEIQIGSDMSGKPLALHPRLTGLKQIYDAGDLAIINRTGYSNSSRSHFTGTDIWNTANPTNAPVGSGWLGRYLDLLPSPIDPLAGWVTQRDVPRALIGNEVSVPAIPNPAHLRVRDAEPERRQRGAVREDGDDGDFIPFAVRAAAPGVRQRHGAGGARDARQGQHGRHLSVLRDLRHRRSFAGVPRRRRRDLPRSRHEGLLGADGWLRHARDAERQLGQRRLRRVDEHAQQRRDDVLQRPAESGDAERRHRPAVLRVRPPHQREQHGRQRRHRPRRGRHHDGHRRPA